MIFGEFVEKEHAAVRERDLARAHRAVSPAAQRDDRGGVMRRAEGTLRDDALLPQRTRDGVDLGDLERLLEGEIGHDGGQTAREHRLARARRPHEEQVVSARDCDLERAARNGLTFDVFEIGAALSGGMRNELLRRDGRDGRNALEMAHHLGKRGSGAYLRPAQKTCLPRVFRGNDKARKAVALRRNEDGQQSRDGTDRAAQRKLAQKYDPVGIGADELFARLEQADGDGEIEGGALFADIRGREIDGDLIHGEEEPAVFERGTYAFFGLLHRRIGQSDHLIGGNAAVDVRLHFDGNAIQPVQGIADDLRDHTSPSLLSRTAL